METRAHHLLIGSFVLLFVAAIFGFSLWLARAQLDREVARYNIFFTGSVAGLGLGGDVRFNGIKVGSVSQISIDRTNTAKVRVTVDIAADTPVRKDSVASLELQGITGVSFVQITAGTADQPFIEPVNKSDPAGLPEIPSRTSAIAELFEAAPDLINRAARIMSDQNIDNIGGFIADLKQVSTMLASRQEQMSRAIDGFDKTGADIAEAARSARELAQRLEQTVGEAEATLRSARSTIDEAHRLIGGDGAMTLKDARAAMHELSVTLGEVRQMVEENRQPLLSITTDGFGEFRRFIDEARILVGSLSRVAQRLEDDPSAVLFGNRDAEYRQGGSRR